jgi:hypothetical protein
MIMGAIPLDRTMIATRKGAHENLAWWCVLLVLCLVLVAPLTIADVPPLLDYPNHLARLFVLASLPADPVLARFYEPHWSIIPNLALDLTVPPLLRMFPVHIVGRAVVGLILVLPVLGAAAYHRALSGRLSYWPFAAVLFAFNGALLRGFLNFIASVGLGLLVGAVWVAWREQRPPIAILIGIVGAVALFFCHLTGVLLFAILIGGHELAWLCGPSFTVGGFVRRAAAVVAIFAAPAALYLISDLGHMAGEAQFRSLAEKAHAALSPVINYVWPLDLLTAALCIAVTLLCLAMRWCVIQLQAAAAIAVLLALFIGLPAALKGTYDVDTRFIIMAAFVISASLTPVALPRPARWSLGIGFLLLFGARMSVLVAAWGGWSGELAAFRDVIASVQAGDVVMTVRASRVEDTYDGTFVRSARRLSDGSTIDTHLPGLLVIEHRAYWPYLFDNLSQQPIETREPYRTAANLVDNSRDPIALLRSGEPGMRQFTHVLVLGPDPADVATGALKLVSANEAAALFAVVRDEISQPRTSSPPPAR